jgi:hypothetical protein
LRAAQDFDVLQVEEARLRGALAVQVARRQRHVVEVDADRRRAGLRADAADLDRAQAGAALRRERDVGDVARHVLDGGDLLRLGIAP